jgi:hypothetical protein
LHPVGLL